MRIPDFTPCWPGLESSLHLESSDRRALFRKRSVPSRRASLHLGPIYLATFSYPKKFCTFSVESLSFDRIKEVGTYMRRRLGGRQPLCGTGVTSVMLEIFMPSA